MDLVADAREIADAAIRSADPARAVRRAVRRSARGLRVGDRTLTVPSGGTVQLVAIGKAAGTMIDAARTITPRRASAIAFAPRGYPTPGSDATVVLGDHPVPGEASFSAGRRLLEHVRSFSKDDVVVFLLSGGGSATVELPAAPVHEEDLTRAGRELLGCGAPIGAMNTVRRHLSAIKGGQLALTSRTRRFATVAISDVVGDRPEDIASGPTVADPTTFRDALGVVRRYRLAGRLPERVLERLRCGARGVFDDTPKPGDGRLPRAPFVLAASNRGAVDAARSEARRRGYRVGRAPRPIVGETRPAAERFARDLLAIGRAARPPSAVALVGGGETTVTLGRRAGPGGRNLEFAVAAARPLRGRAAVVLSVATDGIDGPTGAAGGWVDGSSFDRAAALRIDLERALRSHATLRVLERLGSLLRTGPTGTNVTDLHVGLVAPPRAARGPPRPDR